METEVMGGRAAVKGNDTLKNSPTWAELVVYFTELFNAHPGLPSIELGPVELASDLQARFNCRYNPDMLAPLLSNVFEQRYGIFLFNRDYFILPQHRGNGGRKV